jgi:hypothetical protein
MPTINQITQFADVSINFMSEEEESTLSLGIKGGVPDDSHHDLQQWLERSSDGNQKTSLGRHGLAGRLFEVTFRLLTSLDEVTRTLDNVTPRDKQQYRNEMERLFLWGDGFGAGDGGLDNTLDKSTELKISVLSLLSELGKLAIQSRLKM